MTARKTRRLKPPATMEDAFGTPPAVRGGMMNVAGASDEDNDEPLLVDNDLSALSEPFYESMLREYISCMINEILDHTQRAL